MAEKGFDLEWNGDAIVNQYRQAQVDGVNEIAVQCAVNAAQNTPVVTGLAQGSVKALPAQVRGTEVFTIWGSFDVNYYIILELRGNMLRNAADENYPNLPKAIRKHAKQARSAIGRSIPVGSAVAMANLGR